MLRSGLQFAEVYIGEERCLPHQSKRDIKSKGELLVKSLKRALFVAGRRRGETEFMALLRGFEYNAFLKASEHQIGVHPFVASSNLNVGSSDVLDKLAHDAIKWLDGNCDSNEVGKPIQQGEVHTITIHVHGIFALERDRINISKNFVILDNDNLGPSSFLSWHR